MGTIDDLSKLAAKHKLVPFLGAGVSIPHLLVDWNDIAREMDEGRGSPDNLTAAQAYVDAHGRPALATLLSKRLLIDEFSDRKGMADLSVLSLGVGTVYTTNQDNVFERCAEKYGRQLRRIVTLNDIAESAPGDFLYYKYHGDLSLPESILFTKSDYEYRIHDRDHFFNIRLRSDLLGKNFFFIGYSFRDPNIHQIFSELNSAFSGDLPPSYLLAYECTEELVELGSKFGVRIIDPTAEFPGAGTRDDAFTQFLATLTDSTLKRKTAQQLSDYFAPNVPRTRRIVTPFELHALSAIADNSEFPEIEKAFRGLLDLSYVPKDFARDVVKVFEKMVRKATTKEDSDSIAAVIFNLRLGPNELIDCVAMAMTTARLREDNHMDLFLLQSPRLPSLFYPLAAARSVELLLAWGLEINESYRSKFHQWLRHLKGEVPESLVQYVDQWISTAWSSHSKHPRPNVRQRHSSPFESRRFDEILSELHARLPKKFGKPMEE